jgi:hypothetical protein
MHQANVVTDVGMCQEDPVNPGRFHRSRDPIKLVQLFSEIRSAFQQPSLLYFRIDDPQTNDVTPAVRIVPGAHATRFAAASLRKSGVLRDTQNNYERCFGHRLLSGLAS